MDTLEKLLRIKRRYFELKQNVDDYIKEKRKEGEDIDIIGYNIESRCREIDELYDEFEELKKQLILTLTLDE